jgi:hypothetical protein
MGETTATRFIHTTEQRAESWPPFPPTLNAKGEVSRG